MNEDITKKGGLFLAYVASVSQKQSGKSNRLLASAATDAVAYVRAGCGT